ncbi:hypothetical protein AMJ57_02560 [Parcubacteria bacterium SG8_24]|nr:MAG: hypothetical protein AMJ57_02560 [Parcubacteria bacterium SG8_24]
MGADNWVKVDDDCYVSLWIPCPRARALSGGWFFQCDDEYPHAHLAFDTDDGLGIVPACIVSRPFLEAVCRHLCDRRSISAVEMGAALDLPEVQRLEAELTPEERAILDDPEALERATRFGFVGC